MKIGRLKKVDLRTIWQNEATDFTPWLAKEENIGLLGAEVGLDLEVVSEEKSVGPFRADILCKNTVDGTFALIENQLAKTDHTHLGQLMTYAAGLEAVNIIWIAERFTEEHRAALDWLNRVTDENFRFFGIEIEVYQIGDSIPAPKFQLVSKPNDWSKAVHRSSRIEELTETKAFNLEYWTSMKSYFEQTGTKIRNQTPRPEHWTSFAIGRSQFRMSAVVNSRDSYIRVEFLIDKKNANSLFVILHEKYLEDSISAIGTNLKWDQLADKKSSRIHIDKKVNVYDRHDWPNQFQWIMEHLEKMDAFFRPKIKQLP